jgi:hypothetical protein
MAVALITEKPGISASEIAKKLALKLPALLRTARSHSGRVTFGESHPRCCLGETSLRTHRFLRYLR